MFFFFLRADPVLLNITSISSLYNLTPKLTSFLNFTARLNQKIAFLYCKDIGKIYGLTTVVFFFSQSTLI